jgi:hypothetical protein
LSRRGVDPVLNALEDLGDRLITLRRVRSYALIVVVVMALVYGYSLTQRRGLIDGFGYVIGGDLLTLRLAGQLVRDGDGARLYDFGLQMAAQQQAVLPEPLPGLNPFITPPFVALVFWPWSFLPQGLAFTVWTALSLSAIGLSLYLTTRHSRLTRNHWMFGFVLSLSFFPVLEGLIAGNTSSVSLLLLTLMFLALKAGRDVEAGGLLGIQLIKPQLVVVLLVVLIYKRQWRALLGFAGVAAIWAVASILLIDPRSLQTYVTLLPQLTNLAFVSGFPYHLLTSVFAFFLVPLGPDHAAIATVAGVLVSIGILCFVLRSWSGIWRAQTSEFDLRFAGTLVATCLVSQYIMLHDLTILILAVGLIAGHVLGRPLRTGWGVTRTAFGVLWVGCLVGPPIGIWLHVLTVPLALVLVGGVIGVNLRIDDAPKAAVAEYPPKDTPRAIGSERHSNSNSMASQRTVHTLGSA